MFDILVTSYLFLGGTGAGALVVLSVLECARIQSVQGAAMPRVRNLLLPALFVLSSLSCGVALVFAGMAFVQTRQVFERQFVGLARFDSVIIVLEALCLVFYLLWAFSGEGTQMAAEALMVGSMRWEFLCGLVVCGLVAPIILERFIAYGNCVDTAFCRSNAERIAVAVLSAGGSVAKGHGLRLILPVGSSLIK